MSDAETLDAATKERLADIVELQPTKNADLQERWGMESGSEVHQYLEGELKQYYYRNDDSLICATPEAVELVGGDASGVTVSVTPFQSAVIGVLAGPEERAESVVSVLHKLRDGERERVPEDVDADDVRSALRRLADRGVVEVVQKTVPTFKLSVGREELAITVEDGS
jgi:uncharacterized protein (DUF2249 family)